MTTSDFVGAAADEPKAVLHTAVTEVKNALDVANTAFDEATGVATKTANAVDAETKTLLDEAESALDNAYTQVQKLLHLTKPSA